jgi:hypothetical protein
VPFSFPSFFSPLSSSLGFCPFLLFFFPFFKKGA